MRVTEKGQVTIPKHIRDRLGIKPGSEVDFVSGTEHVELVVLDANLGRGSRRERLAESFRRLGGRYSARYRELNESGKSGDGKQYTDWLRGPRDDAGPG